MRRFVLPLLILVGGSVAACDSGPSGAPPIAPSAQPPVGETVAVQVFLHAFTQTATFYRVQYQVRDIEKLAVILYDPTGHSLPVGGIMRDDDQAPATLDSAPPDYLDDLKAAIGCPGASGQHFMIHQVSGPFNGSYSRSLTHIPDGSYVVFFAAAKRGSAGRYRAIGTASESLVVSPSSRDPGSETTITAPAIALVLDGT